MKFILNWFILYYKNLMYLTRDRFIKKQLEINKATLLYQSVHRADKATANI